MHLLESKLFWQPDLSIDVKMPCNSSRAGIRLAASNANREVASRNRMSILRDHAEVPVLEFEVDLLTLSRVQMNSLKAA